MVDLAYHAIHDGRQLRLFELKYKDYTDEYEYTWSAKPVLEITDGEGNALWAFPHNAANWDLLEAVQYQTARVDEFIDSLLSDWKQFLGDFKDESGSLKKYELIGLITSSKADTDEFVRKQAEKTERYLNQLATGEITKEDFVQNMKNIQRLNEMQALKLSVAAKASAQRLTMGIQSLILDELMNLIP